LTGDGNFTTNDDQYSKFIEWQYLRLKEKGFVKKGLHPTKYCLNEKNPVTTHDLLEGEDAEKQRYSLVKFQKMILSSLWLRFDRRRFMGLHMH